FVLRHRALDVIEQYFPQMLQAEDVLFLLEDAVIHAPPDHRQDEDNDLAHDYFPGALERAVARTRPAGAFELLVDIVEGHSASRMHSRPSLGSAWALGVLAAAFPDEAVPYIDQRLADVSWDRRAMATVAARRLPDALARPRLLRAAADGVPEI